MLLSDAVSMSLEVREPLWRLVVRQPLVCLGVRQTWIWQVTVVHENEFTVVWGLYGLSIGILKLEERLRWSSDKLYERRLEPLDQTLPVSPQLL